MKIFILFFIFFLFSCGYPDVDSVPEFKKIQLSDEELIELCSSKSSDNNIICKENK
tara:strand:- start:8187 stop:8354 length:168 start_codon:yes stop_codon:yes gene_type:complete